MRLSDKFYACSAPSTPLVTHKTAREISSIARRARDNKNNLLSFELLKDGLYVYPNDPYLWRDMGFTLVDAQEFKESLPFFKKGYELAPENTKIGMPYGRRLAREKMYDEAERVYMRYVPENPSLTSIPLLESLGVLYIKQGYKDLACACLGHAMANGLYNPSSQQKYHDLAQEGYGYNNTSWQMFLNRALEFSASVGRQMPENQRTQPLQPRP